MRNIDILNLAKADIFSVSANTLEAAHAYKVVKFKGAVRKIAEAIDEEQKAIAKEAGIEDTAAFDKERAELRKTNSNPERLAELDKQLGRFIELRENFYKEPVELEGVKTIPYEQFFALQKENKDLEGKPLEAYADLLEGVLWAAPEEKE